MRNISTLFKRTLKSVLPAILALAMFLPMPLLAQVPSFATPPLQPSTFMATAVVTPGALTAGDLFCIVGSATHLIKVKSIRMNGIDATAQVPLISLIKRSAASTGGTATNPTAVPLDTQQVVTAATATINAYTAVPTPGAAVGTLSSHYQALNAITVGTITDDTEWFWHPADLYSEVRLRGVAQQLCINSPNAWVTAAPTLAVEITWTEQ